MTAGDTFCAGAGVAVKANAENATANAVAILPIVFITFSKAEPRWAAGVIECFLSPIGLPALVASVVHLTIESLLCCKQSSPATRPLCGSVTFAFATSSVDRIAFARNRVRMECIHPLRNDFGSNALIAAVLLCARIRASNNREGPASTRRESGRLAS
jgi:hypothetical protein